MAGLKLREFNSDEGKTDPSPSGLIILINRLVESIEAGIDCAASSPLSCQSGLQNESPAASEFPFTLLPLGKLWQAGLGSWWGLLPKLGEPPIPKCL